MTTTTPKHTSHIEPSERTTDEVDRFLDETEERINDAPGAGSPATKPQQPEERSPTAQPHNPKMG
jgi:hypothetical protein